MKEAKEKWVLLIALTLIWGSSFILIKKGLEHFSPYQVGSLRVLIAGLMLAPTAILNFKKFPKGKLKWVVLAAVTGNFIPMFLFPIAETELSSSVAGIINSMMPIFVIIVGALFWKIKSTKRQITGVLISFSGACLLMLSSHDVDGIKVFPVLLLLLATFLYGISVTTVGAKLKEVPAKVLSGFVFFYVLFIPSLIALFLSGFFSDFKGTESDFIGLGYVAILAVFGTGLAMLMQYRLLKISNPLFASTVTLLMPVVAVMWGLLYGETLTALQYLGGIIIIGGLLFLRGRKLP